MVVLCVKICLEKEVTKIISHEESFETEVSFKIFVPNFVLTFVSILLRLHFVVFQATLTQLKSNLLGPSSLSFRLEEFSTG